MSEIHRPCARGCTVARRHLSDCPDHDACRGCQPRTAEFGFLCFGCHKRLLELLDVSAGQVALLATMAGLKGEVELSAMTTAAPPLRWRVDDGERLRTMYAKPTEAAFTASEPYRVAVLDSIREVEDWLMMRAVNLVNDHALDGPDDTVRGTADFLTRHVTNLEHRESIGDELERFSEVMSQAHSLAPWREQVARLRGIPCPECHTTTLAMFGGESDVTCLRCNATMSHERYGIWTRILADEQRRQEQAG